MKELHELFERDMLLAAKILKELLESRLESTKTSRLPICAEEVSSLIAVIRELWLLRC